MLDTVRFRPSNCSFTGNCPVGWRTETRKHVGFLSRQGNVFGNYESTILVDRTTGLRVTGNAQNVTSVEVSLPRLLFGRNQSLIQSDAHLREALDLLKAKLLTVATPFVEKNFSRIDLVWNFTGNPKLFMAAHQYCKHPSIRSAARVYPDASLFWCGSKIKCRMYDKELEEQSRHGRTVRVEFELHGEKLRREFNGNETPVTELNYSSCWRVFRKLVLGFAPKPVSKASKMAEMIALGLRAGWNINGDSCFDIWTRTKSRKQKDRLRKEIAAIRPKVFEIDWNDLLPENPVTPAQRDKSVLALVE